MVFPWTIGVPNCRDVQRPEPCSEYGYGFQPTFVCSFSGGPEVVFPSKHPHMRLKSVLIRAVGTWTYDSKVSKRQERLPVAAGLISASGSDAQLLALVRQFLEQSDLPRAVETGREMFGGPDAQVRDSSLKAPSYPHDVNDIEK